MKKSRFRTLLIGIVAGVAYAFFMMLVAMDFFLNVSIGYIFVLPILIGAIPVLFSTKEQLQAYYTYLVTPWISVLTFFGLCLLFHFEGMICLVIILAPFILLGSVGAFIFSIISLRQSGRKTPLYASLFLPLLIFFLESHFFEPTNQYHTVTTSVEISGDQQSVWNSIKNVPNIQNNEVPEKFIYFIGVPKPLDGRLDKEGIGGVRSITWEKGIRFKEVITSWDEGKSFGYVIHVDPSSIPPSTLDEHVLIGGRYFDVVRGSYSIEPVTKYKQKVHLSCTYRITTNLNTYGKWWADFMLNSFNEAILQVIKNRCELK